MLDVVRAEHERQLRSLIMIPSESLCHPEAAAVLASDLASLYAEGLPQPILCPNPRESARDEARFQTYQTRLADRRFYKGTLGANRAELVAQDNIARVFARLDGSTKPDDIFVNVQALSGAAANIAVYEALLKPGDRLMGLDLAHGGHLTHGSKFNFSGKTYEVHSYGVDRRTGRLDYGRMREQALACRPRLIVGGASAYPWDFDWRALRKIADESGALLLADAAHLAGMIAAGVLMNPLPHAHVVTFTTHKTLCGPRGAVILTTESELAKAIDLAVFPGMQGGPHVNSIAAIGRLFELILEDYEGFRNLQQRIVSNAGFFAARLAEEGFTLEYGGTDTHMLLVNLREFPVDGPVRLDGEIASRLLEIAGIVCNKNVIPGDADAAHASGLRFGLPWLTQRGVTEPQLREIAKVIKRVLASVHTFSVWSPTGEEKCRGRISAAVLREAASRTLDVSEALPYPPRPPKGKRPKKAKTLGDRAALLVRGDKVRLALGEMLSARLVAGGPPVRARMFRPDGAEIDDVIAAELENQNSEERWLLLPHARRVDEVRRWVEDLSDGYVLFDPLDLQQKVDGPTVVEEVDAGSVPAAVRSGVRKLSDEPAVDLTKPYFIGQRALYAAARPKPKPEYNYTPGNPPLRKTALNAAHHALGAKMAPFAGWEMPMFYQPGIFAEHRAVRTSAGLFDVSHMSVIDVGGPNALAFLDQVLASCVSKLSPGEAEYSYMLTPDARAIDDLFVYRLSTERFLLVVNASNAEKVLDWLVAVNERRVLIDREMPAKELDGPVDIRPLRDAGEESLVDLALQGPASLQVLEGLFADASEIRSVRHLPANRAVWVTLAGVRALVARTGYTGEKTGFEIMIHPGRAETLWHAVLEAGRPIGVLPAGLGARDSTRIEAGLPLFGHELEGGLDISLHEAGYAFVPRFHVPFFIGRTPYMERVERSRRHILRLRGQGRRSLRAGHAVVDAEGGAAGQVTSFAYVNEDLEFFVLACVSGDFRPAPGETVRGVRLAPADVAGRPEEKNTVEMTTLDRFPTDDERAGWPDRYAHSRT